MQKGLRHVRSPVNKFKVVVLVEGGVVEGVVVRGSFENVVLER